LDSFEKDVLDEYNEMITGWFLGSVVLKKNLNRISKYFLVPNVKEIVMK
jgi:hypothetical protein